MRQRRDNQRTRRTGVDHHVRCARKARHKRVKLMLISCCVFWCDGWTTSPGIAVIRKTHVFLMTRTRSRSHSNHYLPPGVHYAIICAVVGECVLIIRDCEPGGVVIIPESEPATGVVIAPSPLAYRAVTSSRMTGMLLPRSSYGNAADESFSLYNHSEIFCCCWGCGVVGNAQRCPSACGQPVGLSIRCGKSTA
jgi:hypothetical protein